MTNAAMPGSVVSHPAPCAAAASYRAIPWTRERDKHLVPPRRRAPRFEADAPPPGRKASRYLHAAPGRDTFPAMLRQKIIDAAARVYAECGFRGATTRRIAEEAGVNEVTIFRHFGSKAALIDEVLRSRGALVAPVLALPEVPADPEAELTAWCTDHLEHLRAGRAMIRKSMSELEERPAAGPCVTAPTAGAAQELKRYMQRMHDVGLVDWGECRAPDQLRPRSEIAHAAGAMLMAALFGDAMGRDVMPDMYPQPAEQAPAMYVRLFLCAIGAAEPAHRTTAPRRGGTGPRISPRKNRS
jgi:AcrR family transcriptional regulator